MLTASKKQNPLSFILSQIDEECKQEKSFYPLASNILELDGKPYTLRDYPYFLPLFRSQQPPRVVYMCARQLGKSTQAGAMLITNAIAHPSLKEIIINPLFQMAKNFSMLRLNPFLDAPALKPFVKSNAVLAKVFTNNSFILLTYAWLNLVRTRGLSGDLLVYDEFQNLSPDFEPVLNRIIDESDLRLIYYFGTPLSRGNVLSDKFSKSSGGELAIKCESCNKWNIGSTEFDLIQMIKPHGLACAKCGKRVDPRTSQIIHRHPDRTKTFFGLHLPRPFSFKTTSDPRRWTEMYQEIRTLADVHAYNEIYGEPYDLGLKPITEEDLQKACCLSHYKNAIEDVKASFHSYISIAIGVDWSGGGKDNISRTAIAIIGMMPGGALECIYSEILPPMEATKECAYIVNLFLKTKARVLAHDAAVAGMIRHAILTKFNIPRHKLMPIVYVANRPGRDLIIYRPAKGAQRIDFYAANKTLALATVCMMIKTGSLRFPSYDLVQDAVNDFLSLTEEWTSTRDGPEIHYFSKEEGKTDDFADAVAIAALSLWHITGTKPSVDIPNVLVAAEELELEESLTEELKNIMMKQ